MSRAEKRLFIMKRFAAMLLVVAMAFACLFAFAGCGNNDKGNTTKGSADGSETGVASGTFKLGGIGPLTGDAAIYGTAVMNGAQIAVDEINAKNGNVKFEFKSADDVSDAETSTNAYNSLLDWGMQILIGPVTTGPAIAVSSLTYSDRVFALTPFAADSTDELTQNFVKTYNDKYGQTPNQFAADAYDAVYAVYEAINKAGCTSDMTTEEICDAIVAVMPNIVLNGLTGQGMTWKSTGEVSKAPKAVVIKNGTYVLPENQ